jgi:GTP-binding protein EngB required for normal cell division
MSISKHDGVSMFQRTTVNLLDLVKREVIDYAQLKKHIENSNESKLCALILSADDQGNTPLHIACLKADPHLVQILLSCSPDLKVKNHEGRLPLDCINYEHAHAKRIKLLLKHHEELQRLQEQSDIDIHRTLYLVNEAVATMQPSLKANKGGVCFFGTTGVGKSTLLNFSRGMLYQTAKEGMKSYRKPIDESILAERSKEGHGVLSETIYPKIFPLDRQYNLVDMPGLSDNRGKAYEVAEGVAISLLAKKLSKIRALVLVCEEKDISDDKILKLLKPLREIGKLIKNDPELRSNIALAVTKHDVAENYSPDIYREHLRKIKKDGLDDPDVIRAIDIFIEGEKPSQIIKTDVIDPGFRDELLTIFDRMSDVSIEHFDFAHHSQHVQQLRGIRDGVLNARQKLIDELEHCQKDIQTLEKLIAEFDSPLERAKRTQAFISSIGEFASITKISSVKELGVALDSLRASLDHTAQVDGLSGNIRELKMLREEQAARVLQLAHLKSLREDKLLDIEVYDSLYCGLYAVIIQYLDEGLEAGQIEALREVINIQDISTSSVGQFAGVFASGGAGASHTVDFAP